MSRIGEADRLRPGRDGHVVIPPCRARGRWSPWGAGQTAADWSPQDTEKAWRSGRREKGGRMIVDDERSETEWDRLRRACQRDVREARVLELALRNSPFG